MAVILSSHTFLDNDNHSSTWRQQGQTTKEGVISVSMTTAVRVNQIKLNYKFLLIVLELIHMNGDREISLDLAIINSQLLMTKLIKWRLHVFILGSSLLLKKYPLSYRCLSGK